ncbi:MAG TPA: NAD-dependent epimerase/dehydratase family protein [Vicinamibacterales bacterium]|nr:NAD-dependent epimerase/dehydratase family protein [Vicinamibacterales bacterium]
MSSLHAAWRERRVLVTGASGLLGSCLTRALLEAGAHVVALVLDADPQTELYRSDDVRRVAVVGGSLEDYRAVERAILLHDVDSVFHLGAQTLVGVAHAAPTATFDANIRGTWLVLEACRLHRTVRRIVVASSDKAYGEQALPYVETAPLVGRHPYEVSKSCADLLAQAYYHSYGLPVAIARCGNIYGGGDLNWSRLVPGTIRDVLRGRRPVIRSDGTCLRDYVYVKDVARAYLRLAEAIDDGSGIGQAFNFSDESPRSVMAVVQSITSLMGATVQPDVRNEARGEIRDQYLSARKARELLGWRPAFSLESGLRETIEWYRDFLATPDAVAVPAGPSSREP